MTPADKLVARIRDIKDQRADVRRSITMHEALLLHHDTKTVGLALGDVLRATEQRLTTLLGEATREMREAQAIEGDAAMGDAA